MLRAVDYADTAASIAEKMYAHGALRPERVVEVIKDHSTHLRNARMYVKALAVLGVAESVAASTQEPQFQLAILRLCRALLLVDSNVCRLDEADALAQTCERDFEGRDSRRLALATFVRGTARRRGGNASAALLFSDRHETGSQPRREKTLSTWALPIRGSRPALLTSGTQLRRGSPLRQHVLSSRNTLCAPSF